MPDPVGLGADLLAPLFESAAERVQPHRVAFILDPAVADRASDDLGVEYLDDLLDVSVVGVLLDGPHARDPLRQLACSPCLLDGVLERPHVHVGDGRPDLLEPLDDVLERHDVPRGPWPRGIAARARAIS